MPQQPASTKTPETPVYPALSSWAINQKLKKLTKDYQRDQKSKPAEIASSPIGCPEAEAIRYPVKRLKEYEEEVRRVFEAEREAGRAAGTAEVWAAVLSQKILPLVKPQINSLADRLARKLWETGGGDRGEQAAVEWAQGELDRLKVALDLELVDARKHADGEMAAAGDNHVSFQVEHARSTRAAQPARTSAAAPETIAMKMVPRLKGSVQPAHGKDGASRRRAKLVARVTKELSILKAEPTFELDEDFDSARARYRGRRFLVFEAVTKFPHLKGEILTVKTLKRARPIALAQAIVSICETVSLSTIEQDWKKYKPKEFRSR